MSISVSEAQSYFLQGVAEFNQQRYFECHESLEYLWNHLSDDNERSYVQGFLQAAVALHHYRKKNSAGFNNLLEKGVGRLSKLQLEQWQSINTVYQLPQIDLDAFLKDLDDIKHHRLDGWMPMVLIIPRR